MEHESDVYTNHDWCSWYSHQRINKGTGGLRNKKTSGDHSNYCIIEISQNTEESPGDIEETCCHSDSRERPSTLADVKNSQGVIIMISITTGALVTVTKGLVKGFEELEVGTRVGTIQTTTLEKIGQNTEKSSGDLVSLKLQWKTICWCWCEKLLKE